MGWSNADIADTAAAMLRGRAQQDDLEQAVYGFDCLDELGLHPLLQEGFRAAGWGVCPEQRYPREWLRSKKSEGQRCDIVLTPEGRPLRDLEVRGTLFDLPGTCDPTEAYWLEIKSVAQFETSGPFRRYSAELLAPVTKDVKKLWNDGTILHAGLLLILFTQDQATAEHDLTAWSQRAVERGFPISSCCQRGFAINNRIGNGWCAVLLAGVRGGRRD